MVQVFNSKPSFWTRHVLQKPELGGRNKNDSILGVLLKGKESVNVNFMVAIAYNSGVVLCEQYDETINGEKSANIVHSGFLETFALSSDSVGKRFLMDGCPQQYSKKEEKPLRKLVSLYLK